MIIIIYYILRCGRSKNYTGLGLVLTRYDRTRRVMDGRWRWKTPARVNGRQRPRANNNKIILMGAAVGRYICKIQILKKRKERILMSRPLTGALFETLCIRSALSSLTGGEINRINSLSERARRPSHSVR